MRICEYSYLGLISYPEAHALQQGLADRRKRDEIPDTLLLLEHPHVITLGRAANRANVLADAATRQRLGVELFETGRGGDVTYHGPGQLVAYPIVKLPPARQDIRRYVRDLQEVIVRTARNFGIESEPRGGDFIGVWVEEEKLAAIGIRISRWVTMHGFAFNITTNLVYFHLVVPGGTRAQGVTALEKLLGYPVEISAVVASVTRNFGDVFNAEMVVGVGGWGLGVGG